MSLRPRSGAHGDLERLGRGQEALLLREAEGFALEALQLRGGLVVPQLHGLVPQAVPRRRQEDRGKTGFIHIYTLGLLL